ncbi:Ephrin type-A receptor 4 [Geodia barretti]|uniref:Ephrin type-A receptor 4 n=1 Tax=Geodia barretti TaxID=519541 RepID=A0AA35XGH0_GEOBA|nr:Ephrin type-A receptor 4 [Geodia barretti]
MRTSYLEMELGTLPIATAVWNDFSFDGNDVTPETLSPTYWQQGAGGICRFQTRVCGWRRNEVIISQNNWLFTQHISQDFDRNDYGYNVEIHVEAIYSLQSCRERQGCIQRFNLLHYMTNSQQLPSTSGNGYMNTQNYENFAVPEGPTSSETYTNTYNFTLPPSSTGFYIAVQDIGSCIALSRLRIYRENCKSFQTGLVLYPDAPAPVSGSANIDISCVENAVVSGSSRVTCGSDGTWGSQNPVCQCRLGYENRQTECIACGAGQYRSSEDTTCQRCPANCETDEVAADESNEAPSAPCTQPPSAPGSLSLSPQQSSITVRWSAPADLGGRRDLYYQVEISDPDNLGSFTGTVFLSGSTTSRTISGLRPHTQYCVRVTAHNGVSDQDPDGEHLRTVEECTTTSEARPGAVSGVQGTYPYVVWNPPEEPNGVITGYRLVFSRSGTSTTRTVTTTNDQTFYIIQSSNIPWTSGDFRVTVAAGNSVGFGTQSSTFTLTIGVLHAHHLRHPTAQVKTHRNSLREERDTNNDNNTLAFTLQEVRSTLADLKEPGLCMSVSQGPLSSSTNDESSIDGTSIAVSIIVTFVVTAAAVGFLSVVFALFCVHLSLCWAQAPGDEDARFYSYENLLPGNGTGNSPIATAVWNDFSFDGNDVTPETLSPTYWQQGAGGICRFQTRVCGWRRNGVVVSQNNWLFTQHISSDFDSNIYNYDVTIHVEATYSLQSCRLRQGCIQRFNLLHYMTNSQQPPHTRRTCFPQRTYTNTYNFTLPPSSTGFYIAVQDIGSCIALSRLRVYRNNCKSRQVGLVLYPDAPAPVTGSANIDISCVENAVVSGSSRVTCGSDGTWGSQSPVCQCRLGYEERQTECIACGAGQYRSREDTTCQSCPANCETDEVAADECECLVDYDRNNVNRMTATGAQPFLTLPATELPSEKCTQPPSAPRSLSLRPQQSSITVRWSAPADLGGRRDLYYQVEISDPDNLGSYTGTVFLSGSTTSRTISGLRPHTQYCVRVTAHNGVSDQDPDGEHLRTDDDCSRTSEARPGVVSGVQGKYPYVVWNPPEEPNGVITGYRLVFSRSGTSTTRTVTTTNDQTFYIIQSSDVPWTSGEFRVTVAAGNSVGFGTQSSTLTLTIGDSTCRNTTSATQLSRNTMSPNNNRNHMSPNNRVPIHLYSHQRDSTVSYR